MKKEPQKYYLALIIALVVSMIATILFGIWYMWQDAASEQRKIQEFKSSHQKSQAK